MKIDGKVLIVDDNQDVLNALEVLAEDEFEQLITISNPNQINHIISTENVDVVLLDMNFSTAVNTGNEGIYWLEQILNYDPSIVIIMFTAYGDVNLAVKAMKKGATDFVLKPWDNDKLLATIKAGIKLSQSQKENYKLKKQNYLLEEELGKTHSPILGHSGAFQKIIKTIEKTAPTDANILLTGENGTGKSLIAKEIHNKSARNKEAFITVDLGSISETLFESELFGHKKGAFTDAKEDRIGRIEVASGGTLFLDEIGNLSSAMQMKLLYVLQEKTLTPVGTNKNISVDIRLITATNRKLEAMVDNGEFREDLLYRINTINIDIPPLRERIGDIEELANLFLERYKKKYKRLEIRTTPEFIDVLKQHQWPGNVRELEHYIEKSVILCESNILDKEDFIINSKINLLQAQAGTLEEIEKQAIIHALQKNNGSQIKAARELNITRQTIYNKIKKYGL
jgi:DNA-binding NtrC family response regulator